jgi:hypothetical protein
MLGTIFLVLYVFTQIGISLITEYTVSKHFWVKDIGKKTRFIRIIIYIILAVIPVLGAYLPNSSFKYLCMEIGNVWFAFFMFYAAFVLILTGLAELIAKITHKPDVNFVWHALNFAFLFGLLIASYGLYHAQEIKLTEVDVNVEANSEVSSKPDQIRVVLLGDLHLSCNSRLAMTENMVDMVNAAKPDIVLIAGDIFTSNYGGLKHPEEYSKALSKMQATYGVYAVAGNHDVDENLFGGFAISPVSEAFRVSEMDKFFEDAGFKMLYDESVDIGGIFTLVGRIDGEKAGDGTANRMDAKTLLADVDKTKPVLVLQHEPKGFAELSDNGADVVMCGHTHDGQIFPGNFIVPFFNENAYGVKKLYGIQTIVTSGVGYYGPPIRVGTDGEVMVVNLTFN